MQGHARRAGVRRPFISRRAGIVRRSVIVRRAGIVAGGSALAVAVLAGPAFAHVTITPTSAPQGSAAELTFHVPNEELKAATIELQVQVPTAHPIAQFLI